MPTFEPHVIQHSDAATPHYSVRFLGNDGESVTVEFRLEARGGADPDRPAIIDAAREVVARLASEAQGDLPRRTPQQTVATSGDGLSRRAGETEAKTHSSEGRDTGTA
jgi:hypothetical protein